MQLSDVINGPWAIRPEIFNEIQNIYAAHVRNEQIDIAAIEARLGRPLANEQQGYTVRDGVAVIPIHGVTGKRMNMFSQISGGASTQLIERDVKNALADSKVNSILLHIDSPGGTVDGTQNLASVIREARTQKPVMTFADGTMASAAYWLGSAADEIVAASDTTQVGSIGVVVTHKDYSKAEEIEGVKTTEITAGKYKRIVSSFRPLTEEGADYLQSQANQIHGIMIDAIAEHRGKDPEMVREMMADGREFFAKEAKKRGLIDHVADLQTTINNMAQGVWPMTKQAQTEAQTIAAAMTIETIKANHPDIAQALMAEGAETERKRIQACEEAGLLGHEAIVNAMKYDGKSQPGDVAMAIVAKEKELRVNHLSALQASAPQPIPQAAIDPVAKESASDEDKSLPLEERAKVRWDSDAKIRSEFTSFEAFLGVYKAESSGKLKISAMH